jgi:tetratricopeptide (TPR) repeat protein
MLRASFLVTVLLSLTVFCAAQSSSRKPPANQAPPRSDQPSATDSRSEEESSSKDRAVDIRPPKDDAKNHPFSASSVAEAAGQDVQEFHPWDPHRALKDVEVGDFYLKRKNYRAAEARYREALVYKSNDAMATFGLAQCLEKLGRMEEAREKYESYLKILPEGPRAEEARKALDRLNREQSKNNSAGK